MEHESRFEIRGACARDVEAILELARHLDSVNLPHDEAAIRAMVEHSTASFGGGIDDPTKGRYLFVLHDLERRCVVATSMIVAQLGRRDAPYVYFQVRPEERYSKTLDRHFEHTVLRMAYSYQGPTEIGGLVSDPRYRGHEAHLGKQISFVRFLYIAARPSLFQGEILAELMPPLLPDGTSHLWEAVGRRFTGLDYRTADKLSRENKEFIRGLFPDGDIYATLLSDEARAVIGQVGESTRGVAAMLRAVGFRYVDRVDPFDGGPHFLAPTSEIHPIREARERVCRPGPTRTGLPFLVGALLTAEPWVRVRACDRVELDGEGRATVPESLLAELGARGGDPLWIAPLSSPTR